MNDEDLEAYLAQAAAKRREEEREQRRRGFRWHWQNLKKEDGTRHLVNVRGWLYKRPRGTLEMQLVLPTRYLSADLILGGNDQIHFSVNCWLFALYLNFSEWSWLKRWKVTDGYPGREISFSIHNWCLWWAIWVNENEWSSSTPKWRHGSFNILDFLLGRAEYSIVHQPGTAAKIHMPEGEYPVMVSFYEQTWKRSRWPFTRRHAGMTVDAGDDGVPIPGKGESAWDCGDTAILNSSFSVSTVDEALVKFIDTVNKRREHYGGPNWRPEKKVTNG